MSDSEWDAMAARLMDEGLIALSKAAKLLPPARRGKGIVEHVRPTALIRWIRFGKKGVHLEACRSAGKTWWTSKPALARFLAAVSRRSISERPVVTVPPDMTAQQHEAREAIEELALRRKRRAAMRNQRPL